MSIACQTLSETTSDSSNCPHLPEVSSSTSTTAESSSFLSFKTTLLSERRRPSNISFEKHSLFIMHMLADELSNSENTDDSDNESIEDDLEEDNFLQAQDRDDNERLQRVEGQLFSFLQVTGEERNIAELVSNEEDALLNHEIEEVPCHSSSPGLNCHTFELPVEFHEMSAEDEPPEEEEEPKEEMHYYSDSRRNRVRSHPSPSLLFTIQEDIIAKGVANDKLITKPPPPPHHLGCHCQRRVISFAHDETNLWEGLELALEKLQALGLQSNDRDSNDAREGSIIAADSFTPVNASCASPPLRPVQPRCS